MRIALVALFAVAACGSEKHFVPDFPYPEVDADPQRQGDPQKGYDYLINGGYISCGLPKSLYDQVIGPPPATEKLDGRTGDNADLPYNYSAATSSEGVRIVSANCLTCHAGKINGDLVVGLGAADADFTSDQTQYVDQAGQFITDPTEHSEWQRFDERVKAIGPYTHTAVVGVNPADNLTAVLMAHRDPATLAWSPTANLPLPPAVVVPVDVPPWWRMKKKHAMFYVAGGRGDHARIEMAASLLCTDSVAEAQAIDAAFVDVRAWIETMQPPKWPFAVNHGLASKGRAIFEASCAQCHGTYGSDGVYPNELVPLDVVGTDPALAMGASLFGGPYVDWFATSFWGQTSRLLPAEAYIAPPLDGIWATAPFFHNGSVPTIEGVLDSTKRPPYWTRTFKSSDYDEHAVGWNFTAIDHGQAAETDPAKKLVLYDTTMAGYGNSGHTFGDTLTADERTAVIEYLKTL